MPFKTLGLYSSIVRAVAKKGFTTPTPIQQQAIPAIMTGRDLIASAQTGTGKTAAFALPLLNRLGPHQDAAPRILVLEPTRELAAQVEESFREFGQFTDVRVALLHGGVGYGKQRTSLRESSDVVVATVGRLLDFLEAKTLRLEHLQVLVLDEVDRMLDMGFIADVKKIVSLCPKKRQTLLFSATIPPELEEIARFALQDPLRIAINPERTAAQSVTHAAYPVRHAIKFPFLVALLNKIEWKSVIVFVRTKQGADRIARQLVEAKHSVGVIHGDRSQAQRKDALAGFKEGRYEVLVATDIAARGLDIEAVSHVINYDVPMTPDDYVHRIGRTGRASAVGDAFTLVTPQDQSDLQAIEKFINAPIPQLKLEGFDYHAAAPAPLHGEGKGKGKSERSESGSSKGPRAPAPYYPKGKPGAHWRSGRR